MLTTRTRLKVLSEIAEVTEDRVDSPGGPCDVSDEVNAEIEERKEKRRKKIIEELFETEKTYIHHLNLAHKFFEFPLRFNCLVSDRAHSQLFSNLEQILEVNTKLLEYMEQTTVGTAFKFLGPFLKLYSMYANNHRQASVTLEENLQKNEQFAEFIRTQEDRPEVMGLKIGALLITPVQRIPRYKLLLEDLLENTSQNHHDYTQLKEAAKQVGDIAMHINEHVRQNENFMKMLEIQNNFDSSAPKILTPGREFIKEGKLNKMSRKGGKSMERMFFLFSDLIIYGKPKLLDSGKHSFSCCCMLPLRHCQVEKVLGSVLRSDGGGMFRISCKDENLLLHCNDAQDALCWVEVMEAAIRKLNVNRQTLRKPSSNKVPVRGKSLMKMRLRERKKDQKKKPPTGKSTSPLRSPLRALADVDVSNCLTPRRNSKLSESEVEASYLQDCHSENEINLDDWDPTEDTYSNDNSSDNDDDEDDDDTITENDDNESIHGVTIENPPYPKTMDLDFSSQSYSNTNVSGKRKCSASGYDEIDSPQFYTQKLKKSKDSTTTCSSGPFKRVTKVTSSIGEMMDNVRSHKSCNVM